MDKFISSQEKNRSTKKYPVPIIDFYLKNVSKITTVSYCSSSSTFGIVYLVCCAKNQIFRPWLQILQFMGPWVRGVWITKYLSLFSQKQTQQIFALFRFTL
jgi:hypothetical protein